jgi:2-oxoglutarate ferredoxin oxidoreductase subunit beta
MDRDPIHLRTLLKRANEHKGTSLLEIYQNCNVFNDGAFEVFTEKASKPQETIFVDQGQPLVFGRDKNLGIKLDGFKPVVVALEGNSLNDLWIHDERDRTKASILTRLFYNPETEGHLPRPFGIFYQENRKTYEVALVEQLEEALSKGEGDLDALIRGKNTWIVE